MLIDALNNRHLEVEEHGERLRLRRPTLADTVAALDWQEKHGEAALKAWVLWNHVETPEGRRVFETPEQAMQAPWAAVAGLYARLEELYSEGSK